MDEMVGRGKLEKKKESLEKGSRGEKEAYVYENALLKSESYSTLLSLTIGSEIERMSKSRPRILA